MDNAILQIVMRYVHIVSAIVAVGGMSFVLMCFIPAAKSLEESVRDGLSLRLQERFLKVVLWAIGGLIVSGVYNWVMLNPVYQKIGKIAAILIGIKVFLALILFSIVFARAIGLISPKSHKRVLMINIHLAAIIILLAAILRYYRLELPSPIVT